MQFVLEGCLDILVVDAAGNLSSPGFPVSLPVLPVFCEWTISSPAFHYVQLDFHVVDLPQRNRAGGRRASYLSFGDFNAFGRRLEQRRVYGRPESVRPFASNGLDTWVTLFSAGDPHGQHRGLLIEITYLRYGDMGLLFL